MISEEEYRSQIESHRKRTKEMIRVMSAYLNGEKIVCKEGILYSLPNWNWFEREYRVNE